MFSWKSMNSFQFFSTYFWYPNKNVLSVLVKMMLTVKYEWKAHVNTPSHVFIKVQAKPMTLMKPNLR
jgi:hypothetical protein